MSLRKYRVHLHGATNLDFRSEKKLQNNKTPEKSRIETLSDPNKNFIQTIKAKLAQTAPNPFSMTTSLYKDLGKSLHETMKVGMPRLKHLEKIGKNVFTGDSNIIYDERIYSKYDFVKTVPVAKRLPDLVRTKREKHGAAIQETQLVGVGEYNLETLEGKVDVEKVKEIRRIIRRKYGARGNFQKIFNCWDADHNGAVSVINVFDMIKRFGININFDEARVLVASADQDRSNDLNLDEFLELIFTDNEALNVDLRKIPVVSQTQKDEVNNVLYTELLDTKLKRHNEQVNLILRNKLSQIARACLDCDFLKQGFIEHERLHFYLRQLGFSEKILPDSDIQYVYEKYKNKEDKFNYKSFLKELKEFEYKSSDLRFEKQAVLINKPKEVKGLTEKQKRLTMYDTEENPLEFVISDNQKIPVSKLISEREKAKKVFRSFYKFFPTQKDFEENFQTYIKNLENNELYKENLVDKNQLTLFVSNFFSDKPEEKIDKKDLQGFLTNFVYNKFGETNFDKIPELIYKEEDRDYYRKLGYRNNGPTPSIKNKLNKEFENMEDKSENLLMDNIENEQSKIKFHHKLSINPKLNIILKKFDDRLFSGTTSALQVFRMFDIDNDGYVSQDNLIKKIKELSLLNNEEIPYFLSYIDPERKGVLDFHDFSHKIRPNALQSDEMGRQTIIPSIIPEKEQIEYLKNALPSIRQTVFTNKEFFTPQGHDELKRSTRFGSTPNHSNTFPSFQTHYEKSPMFVSAKDRFSKGLNASTAFQKEEKDKKVGREIGKLESIRKYSQTIEERVHFLIDRQEKKTEHRLKAKGLAHWSYEHRNHLKNDWT